MKILQICASSVFFTTDAAFPHNFVYYSDFVSSLAKPMGSKTDNMLHAVVGISGEAGELLDAVKKTWVYNKPLDRENVVEELGDLRFYMQHLMNVLDISEKEVIEHNVNKLSVRYAEGYSDKAAQERADKQEKEDSYRAAYTPEPAPKVSPADHFDGSEHGVLPTDWSAS